MKRHGIIIALLMLVLALCACDDGGGGTSTTQQTSVSAVGIMKTGSVDINGIKFDVASGASINIDDESGSVASLKDGMFVLLKGRLNSDGVTGDADLIKAKDQVQGLVTSVDTASTPQSFVVLARVVFVSNATVYEGISGISGLTAGSSYVEVHGELDAGGNIRASRVELLTGTPESELKGIVSNKDVNGSGTFMIGSLIVVTNSSTTFEPTGKTIADVTNGTLVEVEGEVNSSGALVASKVELESLSDDDYLPDEGSEFEIEGYISGFTSHPGAFFVGGIAVQTTSSTEFENGSSVNLMDNVKVEVEGGVVNGVLIVHELEFEDMQVEMEGTATIANASSLTMLGLEVAITSATETPEASITTGLRYKLNAVMDSAGALTATSIELASTGDPDSLQAPVEAKDATAATLTMLGITADLSSAEKFEGEDDVEMTQEAFFAAITPASGSSGTLVRVQGTYSSSTNTITVTEAELED